MFQFVNHHRPIAPICELQNSTLTCCLVSEESFLDRYLGRLKCTQLAVNVLLEISCKLRNLHSLGSDNCIHLGNNKIIVRQEAEEDKSSIPRPVEISTDFR